MYSRGARVPLCFELGLQEVDQLVSVQLGFQQLSQSTLTSFHYSSSFFASLPPTRAGLDADIACFRQTAENRRGLLR